MWLKRILIPYLKPLPLLLVAHFKHQPSQVLEPSHALGIKLTELLDFIEGSLLLVTRQDLYQVAQDPGRDLLAVKVTVSEDGLVVLGSG